MGTEAIAWNETMDANLLAWRSAKKTWKFITLALGGVGKSECQRRLVALQAAGGRIVEVEAASEPDRDGLEWLSSKGRLTPVRYKAALHYRAMARSAGDGVSLKSCIDVGVGGGAPGSRDHLQEGWVIDMITAKRELFVLRWQVLGGQTDLLTVMDGVCAGGMTLRKLGGGGDRKAGQLEAVLMVALDLIVRHLAPGQKTAA